MTSRPLPQKIYRRRRIAALVFLLVLVLAVVGIVRWVTGGTSEEETTATGESLTATRTDGTEATSAPGGHTSEPYPTTSEAPSVDKDTCEFEDLQLTVTADRPNYGDTNPTFALTLDNPTRGDCEIDLDEHTLRFEVYEMTTFARIWSDLDCHDSEGAGTETIPAGEEVVYDVTWSRLSSAPGQCTASDRTEAEPGAYLVYGLLGDRNSDAFTFNMN